ncbi:site-specific integrase [Parabacteroides sp. OttesenSCG-928-G06]|nr:site-specific integrase [Parabacteroides sp. OttesenSCG-928-G06]
MGSKKSTFNVNFLLRKHKMLKNGEAPICMRISVNCQAVDISIKRSVAVDSWNQTRECCTSTGKVGKELNRYIDTMRAKVLQIHRELEIDGIRVTADAIRDKLYGRDESQKTLIEVYTEHNKRCRALIGKDFSASTVEKFDTSLNTLKTFIKHSTKKDDILLKEISRVFIQDFEFYLKAERNMQHNSALKHLKNLKKIVRIALANEWVKKDPFVGIQFKHDKIDVDFLSQEELDRIKNKEFSIKRLEVVRDIFLFCTYTGLAFIDVKQLDSSHLIADSNGALWIRKPRQKTGNMCNIPVIQPAKTILEKYKEHPECLKKNVLLPVLSNQKTNAYLKEIADLCGITKKMSSHIARHTAATTVFLANNVSIENVAKILGHSSTKMTQHYAKVLDSSILRDMQSVEAKFS